MEPQLKPTTEAQAVARAHRMGQTERVLVHRLLARNTVDEAMRELVLKKRELFEAYARESAVEDVAESARERDVVGRLVAHERARLEA